MMSPADECYMSSYVLFCYVMFCIFYFIFAYYINKTPSHAGELDGVEPALQEAAGTSSQSSGINCPFHLFAISISISSQSEFFYPWL